MSKLWILVVIVLSACGADPIRSSDSGNADVTVELIAEWDGIRLYRVQDGSDRTVYVSDSRGATRTSWDTTRPVPAGKTMIMVTDHHETLEVR